MTKNAWNPEVAERVITGAKAATKRVHVQPMQDMRTLAMSIVCHCGRTFTAKAVAGGAEGDMETALMAEADAHIATCEHARRATSALADVRDALAAAQRADTPKLREQYRNGRMDDKAWFK